MASKLRTTFWERQHKRLFESIIVNPIPSKRYCLELACLETISAPLSMSAPSTIIVEITLESDEKLPSVDDIAHHESRRPSISLNHFSEESFEYMASSPFRPKSTYVPSWEEVVEFLRQIPSFTNRETLVQNIGVLFSAT